jgi:hypothetical protein
MPRVPEFMLHAGAFLFRTRQEAESRARIGGTCFLVTKPVQGSEEFAGQRRSVPYLVTNRHVVYSDASSVVSANRMDGKAPDILEFEPTDWTAHPQWDDVAVLCVYGRIFPGVHKISYVETFALWDRAMWQSLELGWATKSSWLADS